MCSCAVFISSGKPRSCGNPIRINLMSFISKQELDVSVLAFACSHIDEFTYNSNENFQL
jgi:hypothetical protein